VSKTRSRSLPQLRSKALLGCRQGRRGCGNHYPRLARGAAKLEAVEAGISVFDDEFLAHIVMPDGRTVAGHVRPQLALAYETGRVGPLLPDYSERKP
jgi:hypothetical protein